MKLIYFSIISLFLSQPLTAQIDFDVLFSKKKLKKSLSRIYEYNRSWSSFECLSGNCENGEGIFRSKGTHFYMYAKGQFKSRKLNGNAILYIFNTKANNSHHALFEEALLSGSELPQYFDEERCPDEMFKGYFEDNVLNEGTYTYYGSGSDRKYQFEKMTMYYMNSLEPWMDYEYESSVFLYEYTGEFNNDGYYIKLDLNKDENEIIISNKTHKSKVVTTHIEGVFNCSKFINNNLVSSEQLVNDEGRPAFIRSISSKPEKKVTQKIKFRCHICKGKGEVQRRFWVVRTFEERRANNGYMRKQLVKTEILEYVPGRAPMTTYKQTAKVELKPITCGTCNGSGYRD